MRTIILPQEQWDLVAPVMRDEFANAMPVNTDQASFVAAMDDEKLAGFLYAEQIFHLHCLYVAPEYRGTQTAWELMRETTARIPQGFSAVVMSQPSPTIRLVERLGARRIGNYDVWRKDF